MFTIQRLLGEKRLVCKTILQLQVRICKEESLPHGCELLSKTQFDLVQTHSSPDGIGRMYLKVWVMILGLVYFKA